MQSRGNSARAFFLRVVFLGLLAFAVAPSLRATDSTPAPATNRSLAQQQWLLACSVNLPNETLNAPIEKASPDELGFALEDSDEILRADIQECSGRSDQAKVGLKVSVNLAVVRHPDISPPLLV